MSPDFTLESLTILAQQIRDNKNITGASRIGIKNTSPVFDHEAFRARAKKNAAAYREEIDATTAALYETNVR